MSTVCVIAAHALVLQRLQGILTLSAWTAQAYQLDPHRPPQGRFATLPAADAYVLDVDTVARAPVQELAWSHPAARVLAVGGDFPDERTFELLRQGLKGVMRYDDVDRQLAAAVTAVAAGGMWIPRELMSRFLDSIVPTLRRAAVTVGPSALSAREREVREAVLRNLSNKEIASRLCISERTVKFHVSNLLAKCNARKRTELHLTLLE